MQVDSSDDEDEPLKPRSASAGTPGDDKEDSDDDASRVSSGSEGVGDEASPLKVKVIFFFFFNLRSSIGGVVYVTVFNLVSGRSWVRSLTSHT